ncbi:MAG: hypothetical protein HYY03_03530 [Chloroflexi bacterium]|nr:hypothetical protein [Chloroflexota bacterium]
MSLTGPYLKAALLCDEVIEGKDGVLSLIRIVDRLTVTAAGAAAPGAMPSVLRKLKLVVMIVSGQARGTHTIAVTIETPDGMVHPGWESTILLEGEDRGANVVVELDYEFKLEGVHWFRLLLEGEEVTRVPFRVLYQRVGRGTPRP